MGDLSLLMAVLVGISLLLGLILYLKIQAFLALLIASIVVGLVAGMPALDILESMKTGMGGTLGFIAIVVGLGSMMGAILESSGGIQALARLILQGTGERKVSWALMATGFLVSIPVFFDVGVVILMPVVYALQKRTGKSLLLYGIPLLTGLAVTHAFIPPTPGPVAVADILNADLGWVILVGIVVGIPAAIVAGPIFGRYIGRKIQVKAPEGFLESTMENQLPTVGMVVTIIGLPLVLILSNTMMNSPLVSQDFIPTVIVNLIQLLGHPFTALILANLLAWYLLGVRRGFTKKKLLTISSRSLEMAGTIILITGAGGVFKEILTETGAGLVLARWMTDYGMSALVFAFLTAAMIRILQGSSTVAMVTAAGMTASFLEGEAYSDGQKALLVITIASGATILSHVNDSGFWLVNKYFGLSELQTLRSWTVMTTLIALIGFTITLILWNLT